MNAKLVISLALIAGLLALAIVAPADDFSKYVAGGLLGVLGGSLHGGKERW